MTKSTGRKAKYKIEILTAALQEYVSKNPNSKIVVTELAKATGIPRHIWKDNKDIKEIINQINQDSLVVNAEKMTLVLPSAEELVNTNYNNKAKLIKAIQNCLDTVRDMYNKTSDTINVDRLKEQYETKIKELEAIIELKDSEINNLNREIDMLYIESEDPLKRTQNGIKSNLIELNKSNIKSLSKDLEDIKTEYSGLFD